MVKGDNLDDIYNSPAFKKKMENKSTEATVEGFRKRPGEYLEKKFGKPGRVLGNAFGYTFGIALGFFYKLPTRIKGAVKIAASPVVGLTMGTAMGVIDVAYGGVALAAGVVTGVVAGLFSERARKKAYNLVTGGVKKIGLGLTAPFTVAAAMLSSGAYNLALGKQSTWSVMDKYNDANDNASKKIWENTESAKTNPGDYVYDGNRVRIGIGKSTISQDVAGNKMKTENLEHKVGADGKPISIERSNSTNHVETSQAALVARGGKNESAGISSPGGTVSYSLHQQKRNSGNQLS